MGGGESKEVNPCLNPLLLVSGIGGTMLNATNKTTNFDTRVWVRLFLANYDFKKYAFSFYHADTGELLKIEHDFLFQINYISKLI